MKNLKRILTLLVVLAMVFTCAFALVACDPETPDQGGSGGGQGGGGSGSSDIPTVDGKVTLYWTYKGTLPSYGSIWYTGGMINGFKQRPSEGVLEGQKIEGTDTYYVQLALDQSVNQWNEYALVWGYNASSGLPDSKQGVEWNDALKSDQCRAYAYPSNASFEWDGTAKTINLGEHTWEGVTLAQPEEAEEVELKVTFKEALGANAEVRICGGFNNWGNDGREADTIATANEDRTVYSITLENILCTSYEYKILVCEDTTQINTELKDADGNALGVWDALYKTSYKKQEESGNDYPVKAYIEINQGGGNMSVSIDKMFDGSYIDLAGTFSETIEGTQEKTGLDLSEVVVSKHLVDGEWDNATFDRKLDLVKTTEITVSIKFASALAEGIHVWVVGGFGASGWSNFEFTSQDRITWTATVTVDKANLGKAISFLITLTPDAEFDYENKIGANGAYGGGDASVTLPAAPSGTIQLFGESEIAAPAEELK